MALIVEEHLKWDMGCSANEYRDSVVLFHKLREHSTDKGGGDYNFIPEF